MNTNIKREYDLKTTLGKVRWTGTTGLDACQNWAENHPGESVFAWRQVQYGCFVVHPRQIIG